MLFSKLILPFALFFPLQASDAIREISEGIKFNRREVDITQYTKRFFLCKEKFSRVQDIDKTVKRKYPRARIFYKSEDCFQKLGSSINQQITVNY